MGNGGANRRRRGPTLLQGGGAYRDRIAVFGDSTADESGASTAARGWAEMLGADAYPAAWTVYNEGTAGETSAQLLARVQADSSHRRDITIFMDRPNTGEDDGDWIANMKAAAATRQGFWFVVPPVQDAPDTSIANIAAVQATLLSDPFFSGHTFDATTQAAYIAALNRAAVRSDGTHFNDFGQAIQTHFISAFLMQQGWRGERPEATAFLARIASAPNAYRQRTISATIERLYGAGLWAKYDVLRVRAAHDEATANLNWVADQYNATKTGSVTFTTDRGHAGDGSSGYHSSGFNPATATSPKYVQDSAHVNIYALSNVAENKDDFGGGNSLFRLRAADNSQGARVNHGSTTTVGTGLSTSIGSFTVTRRDSGAIKRAAGTYYAEDSFSVASAAPSSGTFLEGSGPALAFATKQLAILSWGSSLTLAEMQSDAHAKSAYLAAIGAI